MLVLNFFLIFSIISVGWAKIISADYKGLDDDNALVKPDFKISSKSIKAFFQEPVWVLTLNDDTMTDLKLRPGTGAESDDFDDIVAPLMGRLKIPSKSSIVKKDKPPSGSSDGTNSKDEYFKSEIMRMMNKFILAANLEPSIREDEKFSPTLVMYFKGPFASVTVKDSNGEWSSIMGIVTPPSPFPEWFYEDHGEFDYEGDNYISVPPTVQHQLYKALLSTLKKFLSHPM